MKAELGQWSKLLAPFRRLFTEPGANRFVELLMAWVLCPGRRTGTHLWQMVAGADRPRYEAYMAFCREGRWPKRSDLLRVWAHLLVNHLSPRHLPDVRELWLLLDDTLFHKTGRKVVGAGRYRDAVRSGVRTVTAWGLNIVVLAIYVDPIWVGDELYSECWHRGLSRLISGFIASPNRRTIRKSPSSIWPLPWFAK